MNKILIIFGLGIANVSNMEMSQNLIVPSVEVGVTDRDGEYFVEFSNSTEPYIGLGMRTGRKVQFGIEGLVFEEALGLSAHARLNTRLFPQAKIAFTKQFFIAEFSIRWKLIK